MARRQQVVKQRLGLCGRAWYSIFVICKQNSQRLGVFAKLPPSQPSFQPIFRPAPDLHPCGGLTSALKGRAKRPRWKLRDSEAGVAPGCGGWPVYPPAPGAGR